jgi:membrane protein implicated in regulation of membrane protease activity
MFSALRVFFLFFFRRWVKQTQKSSKDRAVAAFKGIEEETFSSSSSSGKRKEKTARMDLNNETRSI